MKNIVLFFSISTLIWIQYASGALQEGTMDTYKTTISLQDPSFGYPSSGILKSHNGGKYKVGRNKTLYVAAPSGYRILVSIRLIDLRPNQQDLLTLFNRYGPRNSVTYSNIARYRNRRYYPDEDLTFIAPDGQLGITFYTSPYDTTFGFDGFELVYTVQSSWVQCSTRDFRCSNLWCIAQILKCDGHNHCGDRSSEWNCTPPPGTGRTIGIGVGGVFLIIALACGIYIIVRRARASATETTIINSHPPPPTNLPSYPPAYPQPGTYYPPPPPPYSQGVTNPGYH